MEYPPTRPSNPAQDERRKDPNFLTPHEELAARGQLVDPEGAKYSVPHQVQHITTPRNFDFGAEAREMEQKWRAMREAGEVGPPHAPPGTENLRETTPRGEIDGARGGIPAPNPEMTRAVQAQFAHAREQMQARARAGQDPLSEEHVNDPGPPQPKQGQHNAILKALDGISHAMNDFAAKQDEQSRRLDALEKRGGRKARKSDAKGDASG